MITIADLKSSIYTHTLFEEHPSQITIINDEKQEQKSAVLRKIKLTSRGTFISISNGLLKNCANNYRKIDGNFSFRMDCDGICLLHRDDENYLILTEVKSGFGLVRKKAFPQIITSYVKVKSFLATIDTYHQNEYKEIGLVISYPDEDISNNNEYQISRRNIINDMNSVLSAYCASFKRQKQVDMRMNDFGIDRMHVSPNQINQVLRVKYVSAQYEAEMHTINLDDIL